MKTPAAFSAIAREALAKASLRPTAQRMTLAHLLFASGHRHVSAPQLFGEAREAGQDLVLATVYNTLHSFVAAGLLREIPISATRSVFDTNMMSHHHLFCEADGLIIDIPVGETSVIGLPAIPDQYELDNVDILVRLRRKR